MIEASGHDVDIEVDGGIDPSTVDGAVGAGANLLVAGSGLFRDPDGLGHAVASAPTLRARGAWPRSRGRVSLSGSSASTSPRGGIASVGVISRSNHRRPVREHEHAPRHGSRERRDTTARVGRCLRR